MNAKPIHIVDLGRDLRLGTLAWLRGTVPFTITFPLSRCLPAK